MAIRYEHKYTALTSSTAVAHVVFLAEHMPPSQELCQACQHTQAQHMIVEGGAGTFLICGEQCCCIQILTDTYTVTIPEEEK